MNYQHYVNIFVLSKQPEHLIHFQDRLNSKHPNVLFRCRSRDLIQTTIPHIATFSSVNTNFDSFLLTIYKFSMIYKFRCFKICFNWTLFHNELQELKHTFRINEYPKNFKDNGLKKFLQNIYAVKRKVPTVEIKTSCQYSLFKSSFFTCTNQIPKSLTRVLNCCNLRVIFKSQDRLSNVFSFKDQILKQLTFGVVYKFQCGLCNESLLLH